MKSFLIACAAVIVIAVVGAFGLQAVQKPADVAFTADGVRI